MADGETAKQPHSERRVLRRTCNHCAASKRKCTGGTPCSRCAVAGVQCVYSFRQVETPLVVPSTALSACVNFEVDIYLFTEQHPA